METMVYKKSNSATETMRKLDECRKHLNAGNLFSSIVTLRELLDGFIKIQNINQKDKNQLAGVINDFQRNLTTSQAFVDLYGKVYFRENDFTTSYDFLCQLIKIKEEEIAEVLVDDKVSQLLNLENLSKSEQKTTKLMVSLVERGEVSALREVIADNDDLGSLILSYYNEMGISHREAGNIDKAIIEYKKALSVSPNDENLYYNLARAFIEIGQKKNAEASISQALKINPQFHEGLRLQKYIKQWSS